MDPILLILPFSATMTAAVLGLFAILYRRNGKPHSNPYNPDNVRLGDMSVGWWEEKHKEVIEELRAMKTALERMAER